MSAHTCTSVGAGRGGVSGAAQDASSEFVFLSGVGEVGGGEGGGARFICCCRKTLTSEL